MKNPAKKEMPLRGRPWPADHEPADSTIVLRVTQARKAAYVKSAQVHGKTLSAFVLDACDRALITGQE